MRSGPRVKIKVRIDWSLFMCMFIADQCSIPQITDSVFSYHIVYAIVLYAMQYYFLIHSFPHSYDLYNHLIQVDPPSQ